MSTPTPPVDAPAGGRHQVNVGHLVMGLALLGLAGVWALVQGDVVTGRDIRWLLPVPWVVAGAAGLAVTAVAGARRHTTRQTGWVTDTSERGWVDTQAAPEPADDPSAEPTLTDLTEENDR